MATRQSKNYGFTLQDNNEFVDIETTAANFEKVDTELKAVSDKADRNASSIEDLETTAVELEKEIAALKANQESGGTVSAEVSAKITALESQLTTVNANITNLKSRTTSLETKMTATEKDINNLETDMDRLETTMATVESDIDDLEEDMTIVKSDIQDFNSKLPNAVPGTVLYSGSGKVSADITKYSIVIVKFRHSGIYESFWAPVLCSVQNSSDNNYIKLRGVLSDQVESNDYLDLVYISIEKATMNINTYQVKAYKFSDKSNYAATFEEIIGII